MSTIVTIGASDLISNSRADINTNFSNLNTDKIETSVIDTDTALAANSDAKLPSQKAVKAYVDAGGNVNASTTARGIVEEATAAEVAAGTAVGATGARLFVNPSNMVPVFNTTQVFSGTAPTSFTDLDLSSVVGATKQRIVLLKITASSGYSVAQNLWFRKNGETGTMSSSSKGTSTGNLQTNGDITYVWVVTDASGIIEWMAASGSLTTAINVEAYL